MKAGLQGILKGDFKELSQRYADIFLASGVVGIVGMMIIPLPTPILDLLLVLNITIAVSMMKIANDIRLLAMGPRCGLGELKLPATQPGSSIMPGKVNPVICESVIQVGAQVQANDLAVQLGGQWGQLDLNTMLPLIARNLLESMRLLANVAGVFTDKCINGLEVDEERCRSLIEESLSMVTSLNPLIGYDEAARVAKEAFQTGKTVRELLEEEGLVSKEDLDKALDPESMTRPSE